MALQTIYRGVEGDSSKKFAAGSAFDTAQENDEYLDSVKATVIENVAALASTPAVAGRTYYLKEYLSGTGYGGGELEAYVGADTPDNGLIFASGTPGTLLKRINYEYVQPEMFGAVGDGATDASAAIIAAVIAMRGHSQTIYDGLTKQVEACASSVVLFGRGVFVISPNTLDFTQDLGVVLKGQGSRGFNKAIRAATTLLLTASGDGFGVRFYGNGARNGRIEDLDLVYNNAAYAGDLFVQTGAPGSYPVNCYIGSYGVNGGSYLYSARSCCKIAFDEFFYPECCVFDGAQYGIFSDDTLVLGSFTGSIATTTLTITAFASGSIGVDCNVYGTGVTAGTRIVSQLTSTEPSGALNGRGTYQVSISQTAASTSMTCDLSFGGSNSDIKDCVFYDITTKHIWHQGNRSRANFKISGGIVNPISQDCQIGIDMRNCHPVSMHGLDMSGSVGDSATNGWLYIENCEGSFKDGKLGIGVSAGTIVNSQFSIRNNSIDCSDGFNIDGGIVDKGGNRFQLATTAWSCSPSMATYINFDPDIFDTGVTYSYDFTPSSANLRGIVRLMKEQDNSVSKWINQCSGIELTGAGITAITAAGTTIISNLDSGRTFSFEGAANQVCALQVPALGVWFNILHNSNFTLTVACTGGTSFAAGIGAVKTLIDFVGSDKGGAVRIKALSTTLWAVESVQGTVIYT